MNEEELNQIEGSDADEEERLRMQIALEENLAEERRLEQMLVQDTEPQVQPEVQPQVQPQPEPVVEEAAPAQAVETSPFKNEDGTIDYDKIDRYRYIHYIGYLQDHF